MNRDTQGRYARKSKFKTFLFAVVVVAGIVVVLNVSNTETYTRTETATSTPEVVTIENPLDEIKAREIFKKRVENQAKQVYLSEQIAEQKKKIADLEAGVEALNAELEQTRTEELNFQ